MTLTIDKAKETPYGPAAQHVPTDMYAVSLSGSPLGTNGLMNCVALTLHSSSAHTGGLGHAIPGADLNAVLAVLLRDLRWPSTALVGAEVVVIGGGRDPKFADQFREALQKNGLAGAIVKDGRQTRSTAEPVGERIDHGLSCNYHPAGDLYLYSDRHEYLPNYAKSEKLDANIKIAEISKT